MLLKLKIAMAIIAAFIACTNCCGQTTDCKLSLSGKIICQEDGQTLPGATIQIGNTQQGAQSDSSGKFVLNNICSGAVRLHISFIGYNALDTTINISTSKTQNFYLRSSQVHLHEVQIQGTAVHKQQIETITQNTLQKIDLLQIQGQSLGDELKEIPGVNVLRAGATVSKPVIHGLHSNRILILNNGVRQEGQQWGSEHAPEIDPFIATRLTVIKGAASLRYGTDALGGVILVEPPALPKEKSIDGELNLVGESNGRAYTGSGILQGAFGKKLSGLSWRVQGTYRRSGNLNTPDYNMDNTATLQQNYSAALGYTHKNYGIEAYYSHFFTRFGIFSGTHVGGDSTQLIKAFERGHPVYIGEFSYDINRGFQEVNHDLFKTNAWYDFNKAGKITAYFARQYDLRQEFGFHVPYTSNGVDLSNYPEVYFQLVTHTGELVYEHPSLKHISGSVGLNYYTQGNVFKGLSYRSLIPNFRNYSGGAFIIEKWTNDKITVEAGIRYDYKFQREYFLNPTTLIVETPENTYTNFTGNAGFTYRINPRISLQGNIGKAWRAPSIYELNVEGIHSSTSSYELGNHNLVPENAINANASVHFESEKLDAELGGYYNHINNYIYLQPSLSYAVTYEGTFRVFKFVQTDALFKGMDLQLKYKLSKHFSIESKTDLIWATDLTKNDYLTLIPPHRFDNRVKYTHEGFGKIYHPFISIGYLIVPEQKRFPAGGDFVPPPEGYQLLNGSIGTEIGKGNNKIMVSLTVDNILNVRYREYLNFYRYFSDETGRNITLRIHIPFSIIQKQSNSSNSQ